MSSFKIYVLGHGDPSFAKVPRKEYLQNVDLHKLRLPIPNTNHLAESRMFLVDEDFFAQAPEYVGLLSWRFDSKYPRLMKLADLGSAVERRLAPNMVLAAQPTIHENNNQWVAQPERYMKGGKGVKYYLTEMAEVAGVKLECNPSAWANNWIVHKSVLLDYMRFFKKIFKHFHEKYGYRFDFNIIGNKYPDREPAFLYELASLLYFSSRKDLQISLMPQRQLNKGMMYGLHTEGGERSMMSANEPTVGPVKTFHLLGYPHTKINKSFVHCAYTQKMYNFAKMMMSLGHKVYIYGREDCEAPCTESVVVFDQEDYDRTMKPDTLWIGQDEAFKLFNERSIEAIRSRQSQKDFICTLAGTLQQQVADALPHLTTVEYGIGYSGVFAKFRVFESYAWMHTYYGSKSNGDASNVDGANYDCVIPNYFDPQDFEFSAEKDDYFLYIGRLAHRKGVEIAATACKTLGVKLIVAGAEGNPPSYGEYVGLVDLKRRSDLMKRARAVLVPTQYVEPFGGVHVEAMMCGTPVITSDWGVFSETVIPGVVGYRCRTIGEYVQALSNVKKLNPHKIREYALQNFALNRVRWQYDAYFNQLLDLWGDGFYSRTEFDVNRYGRPINSAMPEQNAFEVKGLPFVSCYCLTYGRPHCLEEAIECFLKQDYAGKKELVILNDRDDQELIFDHPDIKIINLKERVVPLGRKHNECIKHCGGEVLMCWDDDDIFLPHRISYSISNMRNGIFHTRSGYSEDDAKQLTIFPPHAVAHSTHAFNREIFDAVGGYPDTDHVAVDQMFMRKIYDRYGEYSTNVQDQDIFYIYRWKTVNTYHTSDCDMETTNVSDITKAKVDARIKSGEIPTGRIVLNPRLSYDYAAVARTKSGKKMEHIYHQPQFGENWFSYHNLYKEFVEKTPSGGKIVEVGTWKGKSVAFLAVEVMNSGKSITIDAVDTWKGTAEEIFHRDDWYVQNDKLYELFLSNIKPLTRGQYDFDVINPIRNASVDAAKDYADGSLDCFFIDAAHDYESVCQDIMAWLPKVKHGGILAGHDWSWESVRKAVQDMLPKAVATPEDCWILRL